jgi:transposase
MIAKSRRKTSIGQARTRLSAIRDYLNGMRITDVAEMYSVSREAVRKWVRISECIGLNGLKKKARGRRRRECIGECDLKMSIKRIAYSRVPADFGLQESLWSYRSLYDALCVEFNRSIDPKRFRAKVGVIFGDNDFTTKDILERHKNEMIAWDEPSYLALGKLRKSFQAKIYWYGIVPEVDFTGEIPTSIMYAINNHGKMYFQAYTNEYEYKKVRRFINGLIKCSTGKQAFIVMEDREIHEIMMRSQWYVTINKQNILYIKMIHPNILMK